MFYYNSGEQLMQHHGTAYILLLHTILIEKEETQLVRNVKEEKASNKTLNLDNSRRTGMVPKTGQSYPNQGKEARTDVMHAYSLNFVL